MKKIGLLVLIIVLATAILAGCTNKTTTDKKEITESTIQQTDATKSQGSTSNEKSDSKTSESNSTITPSADVHTDIKEAAAGTTPKLDKLLQEDLEQFSKDTISEEFITSHPWATLDEYMDNHSDIFNFDQHMIQNNKYTKVSETEVVFHIQFFNNKVKDQSLQYTKDAYVDFVNGKWQVTKVVDVNN